jgi:alcohol dehydrogenase (cytochrome c)/quinohemoprotein ethanol dehydrogenase
MVTGQVVLNSWRMQNISRVFSFKLGGKLNLPPLPEYVQPQLTPPRSTASTATLQKGEGLYQRYCSACHGDVAVSGGVLPDLRYSATLKNDQWFEVVLHGALQQRGMVSFDKELSRNDAAAIRAYVIHRANQALAESKASHK